MGCEIKLFAKPHEEERNNDTLEHFLARFPHVLHTPSFPLETPLFCFQLKYVGATEPQGEDSTAEKK